MPRHQTVYHSGLTDFALPEEVGPAAEPVERRGVAYLAARWTPARLGRLMGPLSRDGAAALAAAGRERVLAAWAETVEAFLDPASPERRRLDPALAPLCGLSPEGLAAGLQVVLGGVARRPAEALFAEAQEIGGEIRTGLLSPALVILASNLPGLAVQPLVAALALGRPVLVKSPSAEPLFTPAFATALARREPRLADAVAALTWPGGDAALEAPLLAGAGVVVAYGEQEALDDLAHRAAGPVVGYGPKTSLAVVGQEVTQEAVAAGLARDVALFDQRGCLSVAAVYTAGDAGTLARALAGALAREAERLPPGPAEAAVAAAVQQIRAEAEMRGLLQPPLTPSAPLAAGAVPLAAGTVVVEPREAFQPSPGLRTVRVHPLVDLARLPEILTPWRGRLQGAALAGDDARALEPALARLGVSRCTPPGELQRPDATWHNGGLHPLAALGGRPTPGDSRA